MRSLKLSLKRRMMHNVMACGEDGSRVVDGGGRGAVLQAQFMVLVFIKK